MSYKNDILFIGLVWPEPSSSAAGTRIIQLARYFVKLGHTVHFASAASRSDFSFDLHAIGVNEIAIRLNDDGFNQIVKKLNPQHVIYDRFVTEEQYGWRVDQECPNAIKILDTEDLHCLRDIRKTSMRVGANSSTDYHTDLAKREIAAILRCDLSLIISDVEMTVLLDQYHINESLLFYLPFMEEPITGESIKNWNAYEERSGFTFIGNFLHEPNWHTVLVLKKEIWPLIRKRLPKVNIHIYGAYPSEKVLQLHQVKDGFLIEGRAKDARLTISEHRVMLAPIRFGAGLKGKFIDAMQTGTPSVTTTLGAEAMPGSLPWSGEITNDLPEFADAAVRLYEQQDLWYGAQRNGIAIINERFADPKHVSLFEEKLRELLQNLKSHRMKNFIGGILRHQSLQATKYMSLWIQEKNKNV